MTLRIVVAVRNSMLAALTDAFDAGAGAGTIAVRSGTQPALPTDTATGSLLFTVTCQDPAFAAESGGAAAINDPAQVTAVATGTASWFRAFDSTGAVICDGSVTATGGGGDLTLASTSITNGQPVDITGGNFSIPAS